MIPEFIERAALLRRIKAPEQQRFFGQNVPGHSVNWAVYLAKNTPAADVEIVRHGRWITRGRWVHCSECGTTGSPRWKRYPLCEHYDVGCNNECENKRRE